MYLLYMNVIPTGVLPLLSILEVITYYFPRSLSFSDFLLPTLCTFFWILAYLLNQPRRIRALLYGSTTEELGGFTKSERLGLIGSAIEKVTFNQLIECVSL